MNEPVAIAVLAKAPLPSFAKTRLIPALGADGAASLQARLVERAVATACAALVGPVTLWATPDESDPLFRAMDAHFGVELARQGGGDLGARMLAAIAAAKAPALVSDMRWSCPGVMGETRRRLSELGLTWQEPATLWDVDRPEDLERLREIGLHDLVPSQR